MQPPLFEGFLYLLTAIMGIYGLLAGIILGDVRLSKTVSFTGSDARIVGLFLLAPLFFGVVVSAVFSRLFLDHLADPVPFIIAGVIVSMLGFSWRVHRSSAPPKA